MRPFNTAALLRLVPLPTKIALPICPVNVLFEISHVAVASVLFEHSTPSLLLVNVLAPVAPRIRNVRFDCAVADPWTPTAKFDWKVVPVTIAVATAVPRVSIKVPDPLAAFCSVELWMPSSVSVPDELKIER